MAGDRCSQVHLPRNARAPRGLRESALGRPASRDALAVALALLAAISSSPSTVGAQAPASLSTYEYTQDFSAFTGVSAIDGHWSWNHTNFRWTVAALATISSSPPALMHNNVETQSAVWNTVLSGTLASGTLAFRYLCQSNAFLNVFVSGSGSPAAESQLLMTGGSAQTPFGAPLPAGLVGSRTVFLRFEAGASAAANGACSIDDLDILLQYTAETPSSGSLLDGFSLRGALWQEADAGWSLTSDVSLATTPPSFAHEGVGSASATARLGFTASISSASVSFAYACEANASLAVSASPDGSAQRTLLVAAPTAATPFAANLTGILVGSREAHLRFAASGASAVASRCAIDAFRLDWTLGPSPFGVSILAPENGTWTANASAAVAGFAHSPSEGPKRLDSAAELAGGALLNATASGGFVNQTVSLQDTFQYGQNFTGIDAQDFIDGYWTQTFSGTTFDISTLAIMSSSPPSLIHTGTQTDHLYWSTVTPGPLASGRLTFRYLCQTNAFLEVRASGSPFTATETTLLSTGSVGESLGSYNLTSIVGGGRAVYVRVEMGGTAAANSACSVDNFNVTLTYTHTAGGSYDFRDDFGGGWNGVWDLSEGWWGIGNETQLGLNIPQMNHGGKAPTWMYASWAFATALTSANLTMTYSCQAAANWSVSLSADGSSWTPILDTAYTLPSVFTYTATSVVSGAKSVYLRFFAAATGDVNSYCSFDDFDFKFDLAPGGPSAFNATYTSRIVDLGSNSTLGAASWSASTPAPSSVSVSFRSSRDNVSFSSWALVPSQGAHVGPDEGRFVQWRVDFGTTSRSITASLDWVEVRYSAVRLVEWSTDGATWHGLGPGSSFSASVPLLGGANAITVRATDASGAQEASAVVVLRDTFPPGAPGLPQGPAVTNATTVTWAWGPANDTGLGVDHYLVDVGTSAGATDLAAAIPVATPVYTALAVPDGASLYARVRAVDGAGLAGPYSETSAPTLVDRTPPLAPQVTGVSGYTNQTTLMWSWVAPTDAGSGVASYLVWAGSSPAAGDLWSGATSNLSITLTGLASGTPIYVSVAAVDLAGNLGPTGAALAARVDTDPPTGPLNLTGPEPLVANPALGWRWSAAVDPLSGVDHYEVAIGAARGLSDVLSAITALSNFSFVSTAPEATFYFAVRAVDKVGNAGSWVEGAAVHLDTVGPPAVGSLAAVVENASQVAFAASWAEATDSGSGLREYRVSVGTSIGGSNVIANATTHDLTFHWRGAYNTTYFVSVRAVDNLGNTGPAAFTDTPVSVTAPAPPPPPPPPAPSPTPSPSGNATGTNGSSAPGFDLLPIAVFSVAGAVALLAIVLAVRRRGAP